MRRLRPLRPPHALLRPAVLALLAGSLLAAPASAQGPTAYVDDSVTAAESFQRLPDLLAAGNAGEVLRVAQRLLDEEGDRLVVSPADPDVFLPVRARVHALLLADPALLARYRQLEGAAAQKLLEEGRLAALERARMLTPAGFEATLRLATLDFEAARFEGAALRLAQLQTHPDLSALNADRAAALAARLAAFAPSARSSSLAAALAAAATSKPAPERPVTPPARARVFTPLAGADQGPLDKASISADPLAAAPLALFAKPSRAGADRLTLPWAVPAVAGDTLFTNDGVEVSAWDRWTLVPLWKQASESEDPDSPSFLGAGGLAIEQATRSLEDTSTVTVGSGVVIAVTGFALSNARRSGDPAVHAFDPVTGGRLWSADLARLDRQLADASPRGPVLIVGDTAVLSADRFSTGRRLASSVLLGLDCSTGRLRWVRTLANIGLPPIGQMSRPADQPTAADGVVYITDALGVTAAVEAASGRFVWIHRYPASLPDDSFNFFRRSDTLPWLGATVVVDDDALLTIEPGTGDILRLARADGRLLARRLLDRNEAPRSLMRVGDRLAALNALTVNLYPLKDLVNGAMQQVSLKSGLTGRPLLSDGKLLLPVEEGLLILDPARPDKPETLQLPLTGHPVLSDGRLLLASATSVQSFQSWESIEPRLQTSINDRPKDPAPGLAYVAIALKAAKPAGVPATADRLLSILDADPTDPANQDARRSLFDLLRAAVVSVRDAGPGLQADARAGLDMAQVDPLLARLGRSADTPPERAEHLLLAAWAHDAQARPGAAVESLQQVLQAPDLADAMVAPGSPSAQASVPGWQAARDRLNILLARAGYEPYAPFAAQAERELADAAASPEASEALARRYPASRAAIAALTAAADARLAENDPRRAMDDLGAALDAARTIAAATRQPLQPAAAAAAGRLLSLLAASGREGEAARLLASLDASAPTLALLDRGQTLDRPRLAQSLRDTLASRDRRPIIGDKLLPRPQVITGWLPSPSRNPTGPGAATDLLPMFAPASRQIALWARRPEDGRLAPLWIRASEPNAPAASFLRIDHDVAYILWPGDKGPSVECIGTDGAPRWKTPPLDSILPPDTDQPPIQTPQDGAVDPLSPLFLFHQNRLVLIRRNGTAAAFDLASGKSAWTRRLEVTGVYDAAAAAGRLVVLGEFEGPRQPRVVFHDVTTGQPSGILADDAKPLSTPRWVRSHQGRIVLGLTDSIWIVDPVNATALWTISGPATGNTRDCWITAGRALVLGSDSRPWLFDPAAEPPKPIALESTAGLADLRRRQGPDDLNTAIIAGPDRSIAVVTDQGMTCFDPAGVILGKDALRVGEGPFLTAVADRTAVFLQADAEPDRDGQRALSLWMIEMPTARLVGEHTLALFDPPSRLAILDGKVALSAGPAGNPITVIFDAPPTPQTAPQAAPQPAR